MGENKGGAYQAAGVDIDAQDEALDSIKDFMRSTYTPGVLSDLGAFGGLFRLDLSGIEEPVLVASADGVGTKLMVAGMAGDYSTVGRDLVNHCVNDILVQGAVPLFFLDYVGAGILEPGAVVDLVRGVTAACRENGCALLGGETAEMPGFYKPGDYELVGFVVGMADRAKIFDGSRVRQGDVLLGLPSSGLHTNGYSLARRVLFDILGLKLDDPIPGVDDGRTVGAHLLDPHRTYLPELRPLLGHTGLHAMAHITGGGLTDNVPRILPGGCGARIDLASWAVPDVFQAIGKHGEVAQDEMLRVFNMGIGMVLVVDPESADDLAGSFGGQTRRIGVVEEGEGVIYDGANG